VLDRKTGPTRCQILRLKLKCIKFDFHCGSAPDPLGELRALPQTLYGKERERWKRAGEGRKERERRLYAPPVANFGYSTLLVIGAPKPQTVPGLPIFTL